MFLLSTISCRISIDRPFQLPLAASWSSSTTTHTSFDDDDDCRLWLKCNFGWHVNCCSNLTVFFFSLSCWSTRKRTTSSPTINYFTRAIILHVSPLSIVRQEKWISLSFLLRSLVLSTHHRRIAIDISNKRNGLISGKECKRNATTRTKWKTIIASFLSVFIFTICGNCSDLPDWVSLEWMLAVANLGAPSFNAHAYADDRRQQQQTHWAALLLLPRVIRSLRINYKPHKWS